MVKKRVNFNLEEDVSFQVKKIALYKRTTATELYTKWILEGIKREKNQTNLDEI